MDLGDFGDLGDCGRHGRHCFTAAAAFRGGGLSKSPHRRTVTPRQLRYQVDANFGRPFSFELFTGDRHRYTGARACSPSGRACLAETPDTTASYVTRGDA